MLKPIRFQSLTRNEIGDRISAISVRHAKQSGDIQSLPRNAADIRQRRAATFLVDVDYLISARLRLTNDALSGDRLDEPLTIFRRRARRGQYFRSPYLGTREFPADVVLWEGRVPEHQLPDDQRDCDLGPMLLDIDYADNHAARFFHAILRDGVISVPPFVTVVRP